MTALALASHALSASTPPIHIAPAPSPRPAGVPLPTSAQHAIAPPLGSPYVQDLLAVDFAAASNEDIFGPQPTCAEQLPDAAQWAAHVGQALVEVMRGSRTATQVLRWTSPEVYTAVARRAAAQSRRATRVHRGGSDTARRVQVRTSRVSLPREDVAEASLVLLDGQRVRALALRLEGRDGRWVVTALQIG